MKILTVPLLGGNTRVQYRGPLGGMDIPLTILLRCTMPHALNSAWACPFPWRGVRDTPHVRPTMASHILAARSATASCIRDLGTVVDEADPDSCGKGQPRGVEGGQRNSGVVISCIGCTLFFGVAVAHDVLNGVRVIVFLIGVGPFNTKRAHRFESCELVVAFERAQRGERAST